MADLDKITKKRLGEILTAEGVVTQDQVAEAIKIQERTGEKLGEALVKAGFTTETEIAKTLCAQFGRPFLKPTRYDIPREVLALLPPRMLVEHEFVPVDRFGNILTIVMAGLLDADTIAQLQHLSGCAVEVFIGTSSDVRQTLIKHYPDYFDPITRQPKLDKTTFAAAVPAAVEAETTNEFGATTRDISFAEADSDWEALFEEAEKEVMRELKEKRVSQ
jgi:type IV pilus assembly protein PilB